MNDVLPDLLDHGLILVFCGTAASAISASAGAYYANPANAFWTTLHRIGLTPCQIEPAQYRELLKLKIGLTDLAKRASGADHRLKPSDFQRKRLRDSLCCFRPQIVAFTSKAAWRGWMAYSSHVAVSYGWQDARPGETAFFVLPSPSGAARAYWDIKPWLELADEYVGRLRAR